MKDTGQLTKQTNKQISKHNKTEQNISSKNKILIGLCDARSWLSINFHQAIFWQDCCFEDFINVTKGWFPLLRKFYVRTGVNLTGFTCVNKIRDDVWTAYVNVKSLKLSTFYVYVSRSYSCTSSLILFTYVKPVKFTPVRT